MSKHHMLGPSRMKEWLRCPLRESLLTEGWAAPPDWDLLPYRWIGTAVHAGMAALYRADKESGWGAIDASLGQEWHQPPTVTAWTLERATRLAKGAYAAILGTKYGALVADQIVAVERRLKYGTPDLVYDGGDPSGLLLPRVVDWKVRRRAPREMRAWDHDWQLWHYVWEVAQEWDVVPAAAEVCVAILEPKVSVVIHEIQVTAERLAAWEAQAEHYWGLRKLQQTSVAANWAACSLPYYDCEFIPFCHEGASLEAFYTREEPTDAV